MSFDNLTQAEADDLLVARKSRVDDRRHSLPDPGRQLKILLKSLDSNHEFMLHIYRGRLELNLLLKEIDDMNIKEEIAKLIDDYMIWLKDKTILNDVGDKWVQITTPLLDRHNDCLHSTLYKFKRQARSSLAA